MITLYLLLLSIEFIICSAAQSDSKDGLCAPPHKLYISGLIKKCESDLDCAQDLKCCQSKSAIKVCAPPQPAFTACQHQKAAVVEIARSIDSSAGFLPECSSVNGGFVPVQCSDSKNRCWCVDEAGFEIPGTRAPLGVAINCSAPRVCPHPECRMLCPQNFQMDKDGCPICQCYDACNDIKCPRSTRCITEDVRCVTDPCPPISKCAARALDDVDCPNGLPALVDTNKKDYFLCSLLETVKASKCPGGFDCNVRPNKEFGVCCPQMPENIPKDGQCPVLTKSNQDSCIVECHLDQDCYGDKKCCSDNCTARCLSPVIVTPCQAQRAGAIQIPGVFAPTCTDDGLYAEVQSFKTKTWCVNPTNGLEKYGTRKLDGSHPNCSAPNFCADIKCSLQCDHGYQFDLDGCPICSCYLPCEEMGCPNGCNLLELDCADPPCPSVATCKESRSLDHPCIYGTPVRDNRTRDYMLCGDGPDLSVCPEQSKCEPIDAEGHGICCPVPGPPRSKQLKGGAATAHLTKPVDNVGRCPAKGSSKLDCSHPCTKDRECNDDEKCCQTDCGLICMKAVTRTACQVSAESFAKIAAHSKAFVPQCDTKGSFEEIQCFDERCWCVDNLGREVPGTRAAQNQTLDCSKPRQCDPQCRMFCPFEFAFDEQGCPDCVCANPCDNINCPTGTECQVQPTECVREPCPSVPQCVKSKPLPNPCAFGLPLKEVSTNSTVLCGDGVVSHHECPVTHTCTPTPHNGFSVCCQRESLDVCMLPKDSGPCRAAFKRFHYNRQLGQCSEFLWGGCEGNLNNFESKEVCTKMCAGGVAVAKLGQCPVPLMDGSGSCESECGTDEDCPSVTKCCSNGCGKVCVEGTLQSACDQQKVAYIRMFRYAKAGLPDKPFVPQCQSDGAFQAMQCDSNHKVCWCVRKNGVEIDGTRRIYSLNMSCTNVDEHLCDDVMMCRMDCPLGFQKNLTDGCPICDCVDPCENYDCPKSHECKVMDLKSIEDVVSRVPVCAPKQLPPLTCPFGEPLRTVDTNQLRICFNDSACPSTHSCSKTEGSRTGVCCSKTSVVCQLSTEIGPCRGVIPRWSFDPIQQSCKTFMFGGCQGNGNNFASSEECERVCLRSRSLVPGSGTRIGNISVPVISHEPLTMASDAGFCLTGKPIFPVVGGGSNDSIERCSDGVACPLTHSCVTRNTQTMCCPKTSDDCFLPLIRGNCKAAIPRYHFSPKTKSCDSFSYSGCDANGNNFATETQCKNLCPVMTPCEAKRQVAVKQQQTSSVPVFVPDCDEFDGSWLSVQCQPALGLCWCVNAKGDADMSTAVRGYPTCSESTHSTNTSAEVCLPEETMEFCDPLVCRHQVCLGNPKAQCKVNPCGGCGINFYSATNQKVDCYEGLTECQKEFLSTMYSPNWAALQLPPPLFAPGTKSSPDGARVIPIPVPSNVTSKLGMCPPYFALPSEGCGIECLGDSQCPNDNKCCFVGCGYVCVPPIPIAVTKPGQCPAVKPVAQSTPTDEAPICAKECVSDDECQKSKKCCLRGRCDLVCVDAVVEPVLMPLYLPICNIEGRYEWTQCSGEICWCVDRKGHVRQETISRGQIQCNETNIIVGAARPVCNNGTTPKICKDSCRKATCSSHPDAVCVADPCNDCHVKFVDPHGKSVDCQDACVQKMEPGTCSDQFERFYFNTFTQECRPFNYTGCGANENNFVSVDECKKRCLPDNICMQEASTGPCRALIERWFFNRKTHECEQFDYGGCAGNGNNFQTKAACEARCPEVLVCPKLSSAATVSVCNRSGVCDGVKCAHPLAECRVDPCTCRPIFTDSWGRPLSCEKLPTKCNHESMERSVMADIYHPQCTHNGTYQAVQCFADHFSEKCWCVDESGNALDEAKFARAERECIPVRIESVQVTMQFAPDLIRPETTEKAVKDAVNKLLNELVPSDDMVQAMELVNGKHHITLSMTLRGDRAADVSYFLEKKLNRTVHLSELELIQLQVEYDRPALNTMMDDRSLKPVIVVDPKDAGIEQPHSQNLLPLLAILLLFVILAVAVGIFLYRRRRTGSYTSSQPVKISIIDSEKSEKIPEGNLKAMPNDYMSVPIISNDKKVLEHIYESPKEDSR